MTDRRRSDPIRRAWRATAGRVFRLCRRLKARGVWEWWTARGVTPRWQLLLVYAAVVGAFAWNSSETRKVAGDSNDALCALRVDLEKRVASSEQFLRENPDGIPGIPAKTIRDGVTNQQRTIKALSQLACSAKP